MWTMLVVAMLLADPKIESPKGSLVVVGGGATTVKIVEKALDLAGGSKAKVVLIAEANRENGPASLAAWRRTNAARVSLLNVTQPALAVKLLQEADLIWMPGGLQGVFMNGIRGTDIAETIQQRYRDGGIVGGTSAGAAVMSKVMIGGKSDLDSLRVGSTPYLMEGLALWPEVIVLLRVPLELVMTRIADGVPDRLESEGAGFLSRVIAGFDALAAADPERWRVVDATGTVDEVAARVVEAVGS